MTVLVEEAPLLRRPRPAPVQPHDLPAARGPVSQGVLDYVTGGRGDVVDVSSGVAGQPDDGDFQLALWLLNVLQVATFADVDADRPASLRMRTLQWYLEQSFEAQLRRLVPEPSTDDLLTHLRSLADRLAADGGAPEAEARRRLAASAPYRAWEAEIQMLALARIEAPLQPHVLRLLTAGDGMGGTPGSHAYRKRLADLRVDLVDAVSTAPACSLALANAAWLFAHDRRMRGAAVGQLCLLQLDSCIVGEELVPTLERATPWLVDGAAWGAAVTVALQQGVARACADQRAQQPGR